MEEKYRMPKYLDAPFKIFLLTIDEFLLLVVPIIVLGFIFNAMIIGFITGTLGVFLMKKFKGEQGHFYLVNLKYWFLPNIIGLHATPPSHVRTYLG